MQDRSDTFAICRSPFAADRHVIAGEIDLRLFRIGELPSHQYPLENAYAIWRAFRNRCQPAHHFIDAKGSVRHHHFGEGYCGGSKRIIQQLLAEAGNTQVASG